MSPVLSEVKPESEAATAPSPKRRRTSGASVELPAFVPYASEVRSQHHMEDTPAVPNLIGALHTNAYKLNDEDGEKGIYFILPDLSVRMEGQFRLRLRLLSIGQ